MSTRQSFRDVYPPQFQQVQRIGLQAPNPGLNEMHHFVIPERHDRGSVDHALIHLPVEVITHRIVILPERG